MAKHMRQLGSLKQLTSRSAWEWIDATNQAVVHYGGEVLGANNGDGIKLPPGQFI